MLLQFIMTKESLWYEAEAQALKLRRSASFLPVITPELHWRWIPTCLPHLRFLSTSMTKGSCILCHHTTLLTISSGVNYYYITHFLTLAFPIFPSQFLVTPCWNTMLCSALKVTTATEHLTEWISGWLGGSSALHPPCQKPGTVKVRPSSRGHQWLTLDGHLYSNNCERMVWPHLPHCQLGYL